MTHLFTWIYLINSITEMPSRLCRQMQVKKKNPSVAFILWIFPFQVHQPFILSWCFFFFHLQKIVKVFDHLMNASFRLMWNSSSKTVLLSHFLFLVILGNSLKPKDDPRASNDQFAIRLTLQLQRDRKSQGSNSDWMVCVCVHIIMCVWLCQCVTWGNEFRAMCSADYHVNHWLSCDRAYD